MKRDIFDQYADRVCEVFGVTKEDVFSKKKTAKVTDAKKMLYYLCNRRRISITNIQAFLLDEGYVVPHQTISFHISTASDLMNFDKDYSVIISEIERSVF